MANLVSEFWEIDGQSLHTFGATASDIGGDLTGGIPMRGENLTVPNRHGTIWREKVPDQRALTLGITVTGLRADGTAEATPELERARFNANLSTIRRLLWRSNGGQFTLTKKFYRLDPTNPLDPPTLVEATAYAEFAGGLEPVSDGESVATFTVDLVLADPFFYGEYVEQTVTVGATGVTITNPGDATATGLNGGVVFFNGPLTNPQVTVDGAYSLRLGTSIAGGDFVRVDLADWLVTRNSDGANLIGAITYSGSRHLLPIPMGVSSLELSGSGGGSVDVNFRPPYL